MSAQLWVFNGGHWTRRLKIHAYSCAMVMNPNSEVARLHRVSSEPRGKGSCLFGSDQAILDGRLTDNQSISNLKVIFQWSPKAGYTCQVSKSVFTSEKITRVKYWLGNRKWLKEIAHMWAANALPWTRRTLQWSVWTYYELGSTYVSMFARPGPFVLFVHFVLDQPCSSLSKRASKEYHRLIFVSSLI